jgi:hypothetical protein
MGLTETITIASDKNITLVPVTNVTLERGSGTDYPIFTVQGTLNLGRIDNMLGTLTVDGRNIWVDTHPVGYQDDTDTNTGVSSTRPLLSVVGGTVAMYAGISLQNNFNTDTAFYGGGVRLNAGSFTMYGGEIKNCYSEWGGGVYMSGGTFTMWGGTIKTNRTPNEGGGIRIESGTFTMNGGTITYNYSDTASSGGTPGIGGVSKNAGGTFNNDYAAGITANLPYNF